MNGLEVLATGPLTTVQDRGRRGLFRYGVGVAGAADRGALALANRLVGNPEGHAALEVLLGGLEVRAAEPVVLAVTGAPTPVSVDGAPAPHSSVLVVGAGQVLRLDPATAGLRAYVAVRGGVDAEPVLGSRSRDTLAGLGPAPLVPGDRLAVGAPPARHPALRTAPVPGPATGTVTAGVVLGPRADWFTEPAVLFTGTWTVTPASDRVGLRLQRPAGQPGLERARHDELPSEGVALGSLQVPPSGQPVLFGPDHPVTGGYPVVGVVRDADVDLLAQVRPGQSLRFRPAPAAREVPAP
ncbi:biotin-dependent carboxyltransferase family protein [Kineococcus sp. SYSU DK006]|uniref:5-oxoprolinase subunit C family protein n=1 Tax=Kineococcus sp. SYSU DK006 TaxID=3383127 RepID=UPI003D7C556A